MLRICWLVLGIVVMCAVVMGGSPTDSVGWRGNYTGLWPEAVVPTEWGIRPTGVMAELRCGSSENESGARAVVDGFLRHWLVLGPLDDDAGGVMPGETVGGKTWAALEVPAPGRFTFGTTEIEWVDLGKAFEITQNQVAYAQTYLFAKQAGKVRVVVEHGHGLKVWCNGKELYENTNRGEGIGNYVGISRNKLANTWPTASAFDMELQAGLNRLMVKVSSANRPGWKEMRFSMWLRDSLGRHDCKNIKWMAPMPERSTSTPVVVGDRLFVMSEPDELLCIDAKTGKTLWSRYVNYYEALTAAEKASKTEYAEKVDPLVAALKQSQGEQERLELRRKIDAALKQIEPDRFKVKMEGHLSSHFGVVGFTTPMPCSDGKNVYVFVGTGVVACFDLDGNRKWITRMNAEQLVYPAGGAVIGGRFVVFFEKMIAFDSETGKEVWQQPEVNQTNGSLLPAKLAGIDVVLSQKGEVVRASDGRMLWANPDKRSGDTGWNPPVVIGEVMYLPWHGTGTLKVLDFSKCQGDEWKPERHDIGGIAQPKGTDGAWRDKWSAGSPLVWQDMAYLVDMYGTFYAIDLKEKKLAYRQDLDIRGLQHYNAIGVGASPTLMGKYIYVFDNQGTGFVLEPGREFKLIATNRMDRRLERTVALPLQEILTYSAPVSDGKCFYLRGEKYLYCVGDER